MTFVCTGVICLFFASCFLLVAGDPTSCWYGTDHDEVGVKDFHIMDCKSGSANKFCFTAAVTDPAIVKSTNTSVGKGCDGDHKQQRCTQNGLIKIDGKNLYCCNTNNCNDVVCDGKGVCTEPPPTTSPPPTENTTKGAQGRVLSNVRIQWFAMACALLRCLLV